jgi:hypothetical protein
VDSAFYRNSRISPQVPGCAMSQMAGMGRRFRADEAPRGRQLMRSRFPWASADRMYAPATPRYRWPVRIKKIDGDRVRIGINAAEFDTDFQRLGPVITDCGVEALAIVTNGSRDPNETHLHDHGCNGIFFNRVIDCWARDVTIERPENGILFSCAKSVTFERFTIRADSSAQVRHRRALLLGRRLATGLHCGRSACVPRHQPRVDVLGLRMVARQAGQRHVRLPPRPAVRQRPHRDHPGAQHRRRRRGCLRRPPQRPPNRALEHRQPRHLWRSRPGRPDAFTSSAMVGVRSPRRTGCADGMVCGDKNVLEVATGQVPNPVNLHDAQVAVRMAELPPSRAEVVHTARRVGDYWMRANPDPCSNEWNNSTSTAAMSPCGD